MSGDKMAKDDPLRRSPQFDVAPYGFAAPDGHSHLWVHQDNRTDCCIRSGWHPVMRLLARLPS